MTPKHKKNNFPKKMSTSFQEIRVPVFDDSWASQYEARDAMMSIRDGNNLEFMRLYPTYQQHKDKLFEVACEFANMEAAQYLFQQGADVNGENEPDNCPFMYALRSRHFDLIRWMLTLPDLDPNVQMDCDGFYNGLSFAIDKNFPSDIIDSMLDRGAEISENYGDFYPLSMAVHKGNSPVIALLLIWGADPKHVDSDNQSVAFYASGSLQTALKQWTPEVTRVMAMILLVNPSLSSEPDFFYHVIQRAQYLGILPPPSPQMQATSMQ